MTHDIYDVVLRIHLSPFKLQVMRSFWRVGETDRPHDPQVAVIYPPMPRSLAVDGTDADYWLKRLTPQIAFEDFKALQKIEKAFRLMSLSSYRVYPAVDAPPEHAWLNRVMLCLPRNKLGITALKSHTARRFMIAPRPQEDKPVIEWRSPGGDVVVRSPMGSYLSVQRARMRSDGDWGGHLNKIIAKDYAVLARLQRPSEGEVEPLWDYFIAGIRGLGTWGAAWFVDREFKSLTRFSRHDDIQLLLEVTFRDGRISTVVDVSDKDQEYFDNANDPVQIEEAANSFADFGAI